MTSNPTMRADAGPPAWPCGERGQGQHAMELQKRATWKKHPHEQIDQIARAFLPIHLSIAIERKTGA